MRPVRKFFPALCKPRHTQCNTARKTHPASVSAGVHFSATTSCHWCTSAAHLKELPWAASSLWRAWILQVASSSGKRTTRHPECWSLVAWLWSAKEVASLPSLASWPRLMMMPPSDCCWRDSPRSHSRQCSGQCLHWSATSASGSCHSLPRAVQRPGNCSGRTISPEGASFESKGA